MLQTILFLVVAGIPIFFFLRRVRALKLSRGYAVVLTVPIAVALWLVIDVIVNLGRL
jgi:hypothetical protein